MMLSFVQIATIVALFIATTANALPCTYLKSPVNFTVANDGGIMDGNTNGIYGRAKWSFTFSNNTLTTPTFNNSIIDYTFCTNQTGLNLSQVVNQLQLVQPNVVDQTILFSKVHNIFPGEMSALYENGCVYGTWNFSLTSVPAMNNSYIPQVWAINRLYPLTVAKLYTNSPENLFVTSLTKPANLAPPPPPPTIQQITLEVDGDFSSITNTTQSCSDFLDDMAVFLNIARSRLTCVSVTAGSIIYTFTVNDPAPVPGQPLVVPASQIATIIYTEVNDPTSLIQDILPGPVISATVTATTAPPPTTAAPTTRAPTATPTPTPTPTAGPTTLTPTTAAPTTAAPVVYPLVIQVGNPTNTFTPVPSNATIYVNQTVQWVWSSGTHTVVSGSCPGGTCTADGSFSSGSLAASGATYTHVFTQVGNYSYYCGIHLSAMQGTIRVISQPTTGPTTVGPTTLAPTTGPTTLAPTTGPTTVGPTTLAPTTGPTTLAPTTGPTTVGPTTLAPTTVPTTLAPTTGPTTLAPTAGPTTLAPTTLAPTAGPTTLAPTTAPTTLAPTTAPTTLAPTSPPGPTPAWGANFGASNTATNYGSNGLAITYITPTGTATGSTVTDSQLASGSNYVLSRVDNNSGGGCFGVTMPFADNAWSKSIWIKLATSAGYDNIFASDSGQHTIYTPNNNAIFTATYSSSYTVTDTTAVSITGTKWEHLAVTYSSTSQNLKLYRNGALVATTASTPLFTGDTGTTFLVGGYGSGCTFGVTGSLWKPAYYQIEMSATDVKNTYNSQCALITGCVALP